MTGIVKWFIKQPKTDKGMIIFLLLSLSYFAAGVIKATIKF
jgi:hypothetical protein